MPIFGKDQAYPMLEAIKAELEFNPRLLGEKLPGRRTKAVCGKLAPS